MNGLFVTGTDTGVGKTILSASLLTAMVASGRKAHAHKPVLTGLQDPQGGALPDHVLLARACGMQAERVAPRRFGPAVSPHLAAALAGERLVAEDVLADARDAAREAARAKATLVIEGVGGLLVPLSDHLLVRDLAADLKLPLLVAARPTLGTINHTLLTLEAARAADLHVRAVVLTAWPRNPSTLERSNLETIERLGEVEVATLGEIDDIRREDLLAAGESLPWRAWLG